MISHIHKHKILNKDVPDIYPGNTQGRHRKETGVKGCYHVTLEGDHCETQFIETSVLTFETLRVKLKEISSIYDIEEQLVHELTTTFDSEQYELIHLQFETAEVEHFKWEDDGTINDLIDIINDNFTKKNVYVFIVSHDLEIVKPPTINFAQKDFLRLLNNKLSQLNVAASIEPLLSQIEEKTHLIELFTDEEESINQYAKRLLISELSLVMS